MKQDKFNITKDFEFPSENDWQAAAEKLLKGKDLKETLFTSTEENILVKPIYTSEDRPDLNLGITDRENNCRVAQKLFAANDTFNSSAINALSKGQTALNIDLDLVSQFGSKAAHIPEIMGNVHLTEYKAMDKLFEGIDLNKVPLLFDALNSGNKIFDWLKKYAVENDIDNAKISSALGVDPISGALKYGGFDKPMETILDTILPVFNQINDFPNIDVFTIQANIIHNAGGHKLNELSYFLAVAVTYINYLANLGIRPEKVIPKIRVKISVGNDQFLEIAKLRALRILWKNVCDAYNVDSEENKLMIDVETSWRFLSKLDPWTNMLRATSAAFSAIIGGCDSLDVLPFDLAVGKPDEFSMRQARNIQIVLAEESNIDKVIDPASGSGYLDKMTIDLAEKSWQVFQEIEAAGGIVELIRNGTFQDDVIKNAEKQVFAFEKGERKAIGTNIYPNPEEVKIEKPEKKISFDNFSGNVAEKIKPLIQSRVLEKLERNS
ncbi:MAG: hypothetical protein HND50_03815 [Calditrichaeota bacterium]|nr:hypothetical protein [Calditrichota bacterium]